MAKTLDTYSRQFKKKTELNCICATSLVLVNKTTQLKKNLTVFVQSSLV